MVNLEMVSAPNCLTTDLNDPKSNQSDVIVLPPHVDHDLTSHFSFVALPSTAVVLSDVSNISRIFGV